MGMSVVLVATAGGIWGRRQIEDGTTQGSGL